MKNIALLGAGRIGKVHATAIASLKSARLVAVTDPFEDAANAIAAETGAAVTTPDAIFTDPAVDAVIIATPTDLHATQIEEAARAGKAAFCEKPIDLDAARVRACLNVVAEAGTPLMVGFNRRFDTHFAEVKRRLDAGAIGKIELLEITSRDPGPPPAEYIRRSGGLFRDMMIHDFDMAAFLLAEPIQSVSAAGSVLVDPAIGAEGDIDTAIVTLKTASGALAVITNSRRATYGYDQRIEVHGAAGMLEAGNMRATTVVTATAAGYVADPVLDFFPERYAAAYRTELATFVDNLTTGAPMSPSGDDALAALVLADAALESFNTGRTVTVA